MIVTLQLEIMRQLVVDLMIVDLVIAVLISEDLLIIDLLDVVENFGNADLHRVFIITIAVFLMGDELFIRYLSSLRFSFHYCQIFLIYFKIVGNHIFHLTFFDFFFLN